jgi:GMP synthase (glutamine-hydrolysing)
MAQTHGAPIDAMGVLEPGSPDPFAGTNYPAGMKQERGFMPVRPARPHAWGEGLGQPPVFLESHYWEVKAVPAGFTLLASTDACGVQAIADDKRRQYGTQFHPEGYDEAHADGRQLLENFFRIAGVIR